MIMNKIKIKLVFVLYIPEKRYLRPLVCIKLFLLWKKLKIKKLKWKINLKERNFKCKLFIDGESSKNSIQIKVIIIEKIFLLLILIQTFQ